MPMTWRSSGVKALDVSGRVVETSYLVESPAWGYEDPEKYLNAVCKYLTEFQPLDLLDFLEDIERRLGRTEKTHRGYRSRTIDIDILLYDDLVLDHPRLRIPHPRMHLRRFVLDPLAAIAPELIHPEQGQTVRALLSQIQDPSPIHIVSK